jgi:hypothetical protein
MSIICIRNGTAAWDSQISTGNGHNYKIASTDHKLRLMKKMGDDLLVGGVGELSVIHDFQVKINKLPEDDFKEWWAESWGSPDKNTTLIVYNTRSRHLRESATDSSNLFGMTVDCYAIGAGWNVASGAMWAGANARDAVRIVCDKVYGCGAPIFEYNKGKIRKFK